MVDDGYREDIPTKQETPFENPLVKYFLHGLVFSIFMIVFVFVWVFLLLFLVIVGMFIGLCFGCCILFVGIGAMNSYLAEYFWSITTNREWKSLAGHGGAFFFLLILAHVPMFIVELIASPSAFYLMIILSLVVNSFIDGYVGKRIAQEFSEMKPPGPFQIRRGTPATCPKCGARYYYLQSKVWPDGSVDCQNCGTSFPLESPGPGIDDQETTDGF